MLRVLTVPFVLVAPCVSCQCGQDAVEEVKAPTNSVQLTKAPHRTPEQTALAQAVTQPEAENARLKRQIEKGVNKRTGTINVHEHLCHLDDLEKYLPAARAAGITSTVFLSSAALTLAGKGGDFGEPSMSENFEGEILAASKTYPSEVSCIGSTPTTQAMARHPLMEPG